MASTRSYKFATYALLLAFVIFFAWVQFTRSERDPDRNEELAAPDIEASAPIAVEADSARIADLVIRISASGRTRAARQLVMTAAVAGRVQQLHVREGQAVRAGEVLATIDPTEYRLRLREIEEQLTKATIDYGTQLGERSRSIVANESGEQFLDLERAKQNYAEAHAAHARGEISKEELDLAERELAAARIFTETSKKSLIASRSGLNQALINKQRAEHELAQTRFVAPFAGVAGDIKLVSGMQVSAGTECLTLLDLATLYIDIEILESEAPFARVGRHAVASFTAFPGERFEGKVVAVNPIIDSEKKTRRATVLIDNPKQKVIPGMFAFVKLDAEIHIGRLLVPREAVVLRDNRPVVFVARTDANGDLRAVWNYVELGLQNEEYAEILSSRFDLRAGEPVVTSNHYTMIHDALIRIVE